ncbi:MAG: hypothetical protein ABSG42_06890, partial [Nitrospirota bacterium]
VDETLLLNITAVCGDGLSPGVHKMLENIRSVLCGATLGLEIRPVRLLREAFLFDDGQAIAFTATYAVMQQVLLPAEAQGAE